MKKIISIIIILIIVVIGLVLLGNKKVEAPIDENNQDIVATSTAITIPGLNLMNGSYSVDTKDAKITWTENNKTTDKVISKGTIDLLVSEFEVNDGGLVSNKFTIDITGIKSIASTTEFSDATFIANEFIASTTPGEYIVRGDLAIKGLVGEVLIPMSINQTDSNIIVVKGNTILDGLIPIFDNPKINVKDSVYKLSFDLQLKITNNTATSTEEVESI